MENILFLGVPILKQNRVVQEQTAPKNLASGKVGFGKQFRDILKCLSIGTPKTINFPFVPNGKLMVLGVPIFENK